MGLQQMLRGLVVGTAIHEILRGFNDGSDEKSEGEGKLKRISVLVTDISICHNSHEMRNPRTKEKSGKEILQRAWVHIHPTEYSPKPHITCNLGSGG